LRRDVTADLDVFGSRFFNPQIDILFERGDFTFNALEYFNLLHDLIPEDGRCGVRLYALMKATFTEPPILW
jgi:hypothetical protein